MSASILDLPLTGELRHAKFISSTVSFYVGWVSSITTTATPQSFGGNNVAYLMSYDLSNACVTHSYIPSATVSLTTDLTSFISSNVDTTNRAYGVKNGGTGHALVSSTGSGYYLNTWCVPIVTIIPPTIANQQYDINSAAFPITIPPFTLSQTCTDAAFTYVVQVFNGVSYVSLSNPPFSYSAGTLTVYTTNNAHLGSHSIKVTATLTNNG